MTAVTLLEYGTPLMVLACVLAGLQKLRWHAPPRTEAEARYRAYWATSRPLPQLGVQVRPDGYVYTLAGGCLAPLAGATAAAVPMVPVATTVKPALGWATIQFADTTTRRAVFALRDLAQAQAQADRFNRLAAATATTGFARTRPAGMGP